MKNVRLVRILISLVLCTVFLAIPAGNAHAMPFNTAVEYTAGTVPVYVAAGDFNRDGKADLAVANYSTNDVSILLGDGDGTFTAASSPAVGTIPISVAVGDFNKDGDLDLAAANNGSNDVSILLGAGDGTFGTKVDYTAGTGPYSVAVGDFDRDGKPDLAVANYADNNVSILLGAGDGTFGTKVDYTAGTGPYSVAVGDFDRDGRPDLATANASVVGNVSILLGVGDGTFGTKADYPAGTSPYSVVVGDFNLDGAPDLAAANNGSNDVSILLGDGLGAFAAVGNYAVGNYPHSVAVGDFNLDGKPDLATANYYGNNVSILLGNADGTFILPAVNYATGTNPFSVAVGDFNLDGAPDLAVANTGSSNVSILLNTPPAASVSFNAAVNYATGTSPHSVAVGDFNRDGTPDLATANTNSNNVSVLLGDGDGTFTAAASPAAGTNPGTVAVGDFDRDGKADLAVANSGSGDVSILLGDGDGTFTAAASPAAGTNPSSVAVGDFDRDGALDLAVANLFGHDVSVLLGNGDGTFGTAVNYPADTRAASVAVGDFDRDGALDLAVSNQSTNNVSVLINNGSGGFAAAVNYTVGTDPEHVAVGDFDRDSKPDLAVTNFGSGDVSGDVSILLGDGDGTFTAAASPAAGSHPQSVAIGDFNLDGKPDLAVATYDDDNVSILLGDGLGAFATAVNYTAGPVTYSIAAGDFNRDGRTDLAVSNYYGNNVSILLNAPLTVAPTVTTDNATDVEETTATLNGDITNTGGENCDERGFLWATSSHGDPGNTNPYTTGYTSIYINNGSFGIGAFNYPATSLLKGTKHYYRAWAHNSGGWAYGSEQSFTTKPDSPTDFIASAVSSSQIDLSWTPGDGAQKTMVRRSDSGYPTAPNNDDEAYFGTGTGTSDTGLTPETTYYYSAWSWVEGSDVWSDGIAQNMATTQEAAAPTVTLVDPDNGIQGDTLIVTITGTDFTDVTEVDFGADITDNGFTMDNSTQISDNITIAANAALGARDVSVTTPAGTGTLTAGFTVTAAPPPVIPDVFGDYSIKGSIKFYDWKCNKWIVVKTGTLHITTQDEHKITGYFEPGISIAGWPSPVPVKGYVGPFERDAKGKIKNKPRLSLVAKLGTYCEYPDETYVTYIINGAIKWDKKTDAVKSIKCTINGWGELSTAFDDDSPSVGQFEGKFTATPIP